jgi:hypothetical protein
VALKDGGGHAEGAAAGGVEGVGQPPIDLGAECCVRLLIECGGVPVELGDLPIECFQTAPICIGFGGVSAPDVSRKVLRFQRVARVFKSLASTSSATSALVARSDT